MDEGFFYYLTKPVTDILDLVASKFQKDIKAATAQGAGNGGNGMTGGGGGAHNSTNATVARAGNGGSSNFGYSGGSGAWSNNSLNASRAGGGAGIAGNGQNRSVNDNTGCMVWKVGGMLVARWRIACVLLVDTLVEWGGIPVVKSWGVICES